MRRLGCSFGALSLPVGISTCLITRALGMLSKVHGGLPTGFCGTVGCNVMTNVVITHRALSLTYVVTKMMVF